jgi:hypothetical protein
VCTRDRVERASTVSAIAASSREANIGTPDQRVGVFVSVSRKSEEVATT